MPPRQSIPASQKAALRARKRLRPADTQKDLKEWFLEEFNHSLSSSTISEILSPRYEHLDDDGGSMDNRDLKRQRRENWPELEDALFKWIQHAEGKIPINAETIRQKARFFWENIPVYEGQKIPSFSNGWLYKFQARKSVKWFKKHGEAASLSVSAEQQMVVIRQALQHFQPRDIFNANETGLYWKMFPDRGFSTRQLPGRKKEKTRVSIHFCCNSDGSQRLAPWFIGTAKNPRAFKASGINIKNFNIIWRNNAKAWMSGSIFEEWIRWFDRQMAGRSVALLLDNFSAHEAGIDLLESKGFKLENTTIIWLPANSTSRFQPLDQGIINTWKTLWKRRWIRYILEEFEANREPLSTMNILKAIRWSIPIWESDLSSRTIQNCFYQALQGSISSTYKEHIDSSVMTDIQEAFQQLKVSKAVSELMDINTFLNPEEEIVADDIEQIDTQILAQYGPEIDDDDEVGMEEVPIISVDDAWGALKTLRLYEEQQAEGVPGLIQLLNRHERVLMARKTNSQAQRDIRNYFTA